MSEFYPNTYYSYDRSDEGKGARVKGSVKSILALYGPQSLFRGRPWYEIGQFRCMRDANLPNHAKVLDVGCGSGKFISQLFDVGFKNVAGVDPFIESDIAHNNGVKIKKCDLSAVDDKYDCVMMHHSLEHIWDQNQTITDIHRITKPGGRVIIRVPTCDSYAYQTFGIHWAQLDAPRHFYLHSRRSVALMLGEAGFQVKAIVDDPSTWSLLGSEKIRRGLPLIDPVSSTMGFETLFSPQERADSWRETLRLCAASQGDQITVHAERI